MEVSKLLSDLFLLPVNYITFPVSVFQLPASQRMSEREIKEQEEDELQLAIALSLSEGSQDVRAYL